MSDPIDIASTDSTEGRPPGRHERADGVAQRRSRLVRLVVLVSGLIAVTALGLVHQLGGTKIVGVDALCPFGGIETLWALVTSATFVKQIAASSVVLLGAILVLAVLFRRSFCGQLCPLGALQELFGKVGKVVWRRARPQVPAAIDRPARFLKYVVLVVIAVWSWQAAELVIRPYDPWVAWMHLSSAEVLAEFSIGLAVLGASLVGSIVYERFFCKYLCPTGALLGAISRFSLFKVRRNVDTCIDCRLCDKACPSNIKVSEVAVVESPECINCNECVNVCPVKDTLEVSTKASPSGKRTVLTALQMTVAVVAIVAALVGVATAVGTFSWTLPSLEQSAATNGGTVNADDIRGSMSFAEVAVATGLPAAEFMSRFGVSEADMALPMKDIAERYGFDVHTDVREFVSERLAAGR
ncbi:MAG TPA: 4Fe-4S binding protein [Coriobacteriia bacterium]